MSNKLPIDRKILDSLYSRANDFDDPEIQSHWVKYLCILSSGHIENSIRHIYGRYAENKANQNIANYIQNNLRRFQNPKTQKIIDLTSAFNKEWGDQLKEFISEEMKDSINSIVGLKNAIAHGQSVSVTYSTLKKYWENTIKVLEFIENQSQKNK
jgi:hypothetical protein